MKFFISILFLLFGLEIACGQCLEEEISSQKRTAIVFGEKDYQFAGVLANPLNDAEDISATLKKLGFEVFTYYNTDLRTMNTAIDNWFLKIKEYDVALFYFSGHGAEVDGENYIFPIDANPITPNDLKYVAYPVNKILGRMDDAQIQTNIMLLDACRNNPFKRKWSRDISTSNGLAPMTAKGAFIGFAASPGFTASDGDARNGTYTEAILNNITIPNLTIDQIFTRVNKDVRKRSNENQIPFKNSSLSNDFCFFVAEEKIQKINELDKVFAYNIKSLLHKVEFNSTISDVISYEYGNQATSSVSYESLPIANECTNQNIRYYWRYLNQSKMGREIYSYLVAKGLREKVSNDSYIIYAFKENKLIRVSLRVFPTTYDLIPKFLESLGQNNTKYSDKYQAFVEGNYYISGSSFTDVNSTEIMIANEVGYKACIHDWWHK